MIVEPGFVDHWKVKQLRLVTGEVRAVEHVLRLWGHCQTSGRWIFPNMTDYALAAIVGWEGTPHKIRVALIDVGFIEDHPTDVIVHEWEVFNAGLIANWENGRRGGRPVKAKNKPNDNPPETHGLLMGYDRVNPTETQVKPIDNPSITHGEPMENPRANPSITDKIREEKIREEEKIAGTGEPETSLHFKKFKESKVLLVDDEFLQRIRVEYSKMGVDVNREMIRLKGWLLSPRGRGKKLTRARLINWLNRCDGTLGDQAAAIKNKITGI